MKKQLFIAVLLATLPFMAGCKTTIKDGPTHVIVEDGRHGNGNFCPPGQAKKGRC